MNRQEPVVCRLTGAVAFVTGAGSGIGRAVARRLASEGAAVAAFDSNEASCAETVSAIVAEGACARAFAGDVTDRLSVRGAVADAVAAFGSIDILVNNAGIGRPAMFHEITDADWQAIIGTNLGGVFIVSQEVAAHMLAAGAGRIVNIASLAAHTANDAQAAYAAAKGGVAALTRVMAFELAPRGILVNAVSPGPIDTDLARSMLTAQARQCREARIPQGRLGMPEEVAAAVAFLASPDAAYVNGEVLVVDGGLRIAGIRAE